MKAIILALIVAVALAGRAYNGNRLTVTRGSRCSFNFGEGNQDRYGNWNLNWDNRYSYTCSGYPSWLSWNGQILSGYVPDDWTGRFQINVGYKGRRSGRYSYWITSDDQFGDNSWNDFWWWNDVSKGGVTTIACPSWTYSQIQGFTTPGIDIPAINIPAVNIPGVVVPDITVPNYIGNYGNRGFIGSYNCGTTNWSGSAVITFIGSNYYTLDNGNNVYFTNCSSRRYRSGWNNFSINDRVRYECYNDGSRIWAKRVDWIN